MKTAIVLASLLVGGLFAALWTCRWKIATWMMGLTAYHWTARVILPRVRWRFRKPNLPAMTRITGWSKLRPGDFLLSRKRGYLNALLTPGYWKHAGLVLDNGFIAEMTANGFGLVSFDEFCHADRVAAFRCLDWDEEYIRKVVIPTCLSFENKDYDDLFELGVKALYCSELIYESDPERRLDVNLSDLKGLGRQYVSPQDLAEIRNGQKVWNSEVSV